MRAPDWDLEGIRLILTVTPGRSGTGFLCELLRAVPAIHSAHEPEPKFSHLMRAVQHDAAIARQFWLSQKLPAIRRCARSTYVETSHLACKGFIEPLIENGCPPDLIVLERDPFLVATSLLSLATDPGPNAAREPVSPETGRPERSVARHWQELPDWALCFWYCREIERRMEMYTNVIRERGRRVMTTSITRLQTDDGTRRFLGFVGANDSLLTDTDFLARRNEKVNQKTEMKRPGGTFLSAQEMVNWANEVDTRLAARRSQF
jgi:hypothetical protein